MVGKSKVGMVLIICLITLVGLLSSPSVSAIFGMNSPTIINRIINNPATNVSMVITNNITQDLAPLNNSLTVKIDANSTWFTTHPYDLNYTWVDYFPQINAVNVSLKGLIDANSTSIIGLIPSISGLATDSRVTALNISLAGMIGTNSTWFVTNLAPESQVAQNSTAFSSYLRWLNDSIASNNTDLLGHVDANSTNIIGRMNAVNSTIKNYTWVNYTWNYPNYTWVNYTWNYPNYTWVNYTFVNYTFPSPTNYASNDSNLLGFIQANSTTFVTWIQANSSTLAGWITANNVSSIKNGSDYNTPNINLTGKLFGNGSINVSGNVIGVGTYLTALNADNIGSGTVVVGRGGTGVTLKTGTGAVVLNIAPTISNLTMSVGILNSWFKLGNITNITCNVAVEAAVLYNASSHRPMYCNSTNWIQI